MVLVMERPWSNICNKTNREYPEGLDARKQLKRSPKLSLKKLQAPLSSILIPQCVSSILDVVGDHNSQNNSHNDEDNDDDEETNPSLLTSRTCRINGLIGVIQAEEMVNNILSPRNLMLTLSQHPSPHLQP